MNDNKHIVGPVLALILGALCASAFAQTQQRRPAATPAPAAAPTAAPTAAAAAKPGELYSQQQFDLILQERLAQGAPDGPELRAALREELINRELLVRAAKAKNLDKESQVKTQMQVASDSVLIRAYLSDYFRTSPITDDMLRKEYDTIKSSLGDKEYRARHILVEKRDEAESIIKQLQDGAKFADLAKAQSKDPGSKDNGGDLDWAVPSNFVKPFADALVALEKGKFTAQPVQTPFGFHVILLEDVRAAQVPPFEEVKGQIAQRLQQQTVEKHVEELRNRAGVKN